MTIHSHFERPHLQWPAGLGAVLALPAALLALSIAAALFCHIVPWS